MNPATHERVPRDDLIEYLGRDPDDETLTFLGITRRQWRAWIARPMATLPISLVRLMRYRRRCDLAELLGGDWDGWRVHGRHLEVPGLKRALPSNELAGLWLWSSQRAGLEHRVRLLERDLEQLTAAHDALERRAAYYRGLVCLEASMGMMLARVAQ